MWANILSMGSEVDDPGEPHDEPNPFRPTASPGPQTPPWQDDQRRRARQSFQAAQKQAEKDRQRQKKQDEDARRDKSMEEMRSILEKIRENEKK